MNLDTIRKRILWSTNLICEFFSYFESFKSYGSLNVIINVWIVKILLKFKRKDLGNHKSKVYEPTYHSKENFMLYKFDWQTIFCYLNCSKVLSVYM